MTPWNAERTAATGDHRGRHHTGDPGRLDEDGYLLVSARLKDLIIRGGVNISAAEVEGYVGANPAVAQVAMVPYPDERLGEKHAPSSSRSRVSSPP
ncbi:hypothetical protein [Pseudonocardia sp. NPDC049154]|uniref:hypothetical protein n=1 Tax=Pseudonocardia sp. NPDC049154 TaxID=3155501 RepID=UPI0033E2CD09